MGFIADCLIVYESNICSKREVFYGLAFTLAVIAVSILFNFIAGVLNLTEQSRLIAITCLDALGDDERHENEKGYIAGA